MTLLANKFIEHGWYGVSGSHCTRTASFGWITHFSSCTTGSTLDHTSKQGVGLVHAVACDGLRLRWWPSVSSNFGRAHPDDLLFKNMFNRQRFWCCPLCYENTLMVNSKWPVNLAQAPSKRWRTIINSSLNHLTTSRGTNGFRRGFPSHLSHLVCPGVCKIMCTSTRQYSEH